MTVKNVVVGGMTGGVGHVGVVTQGFGGTYTEPVRIITDIVTLRFAVKEKILELVE